MNYYKYISADNKSNFKLSELIRYKDLIFLFVRRNFSLKYKQTILGPLWLIINPLLTSIVHLIVFGSIAKIGTDGIPQILFYFTSTALWLYFSECVIINSTTFISNANLFGKVYFPRLIVPISNVISSFLKLVIQFILILILLIYYSINNLININLINYLFIIPILIVLGIMGMAIGLIVSSLTAKYRDLNVLVSFSMNLLMYGSCIVYPLSSLSNTWYTHIIEVNPLTYLVEAFRYCLFNGGTINIYGLIYSIVFTLIVGIISFKLFNKVERTFIDTV